VTQQNGKRLEGKVASKHAVYGMIKTADLPPFKFELADN
jgi:hypothetical protein